MKPIEDFTNVIITDTDYPDDPVESYLVMKVI